MQAIATGPDRSFARTSNATVAPDASVHSRSTSAGTTVKAGGCVSPTVTSKELVLVLPEASRAVATTVVTPRGSAEGATDTSGRGSQASVAVTPSEAGVTLVAGPLSSIVWSSQPRRTGA